MSPSRSLLRTLVWSAPLAAFGYPTFIAGIASADIYDAPVSYYSTALTAGVIQTGATLKQSLNDIIDGHNVVSYDNARKALQVTDGVIGSANLMVYFYDNTTVDLSTINNDGTNSGSDIKGWESSNGPWNREHTWPQSRGAGSANPHSDLHMLRPSDSSTNGSRGNLNYGGTGTTPAVSGSYFYPGNVNKGDAARASMYADVRYDGTDGSGPDLQLVDGNPAANINQMGNKADIVRFNYEDVPDQWERKRNDAIYSSANWFNTPNRASAVGITSGTVSSFVQGNRNPFVDHPEWAWSIFVDQANDSNLTLVGGTTNVSTGVSTLAANLGRKMVGAGGTFSQSVTINKAGADYTYFNVATTGAATSTVTGAYNAFTVAATRALTVGLPATGSPGLVSGTVVVDNLDITTGGGAGAGANDGNDVITLSAALVNNRTLNATTVNLGRVIAGSTTGAANTTITSPTGQDNALTRVTLGAASVPKTVAGGTVTLAAGTAYQFGNLNDATNSTLRGVTGSFTAAGAVSGTTSFTPTAEGLSGETVQSFNLAYSATVLSHSNPSLSSSSDINSLTGPSSLSFGVVAQGSGLTTLPFSVANLITGSAAFTAMIDLDSFSVAGNTAALTTNLPTSFTNLPAGSTNSYLVTLNTSTLGTFSATYTLLLSDENGVAGGYAAESQMLSFTATGTIDEKQWFASGGGTWSQSGNWLGAVPNGADQTANFLDHITADSTIMLDGSRTVGSLRFDAASRYTVDRSDGTSTLTLQSGTAATVSVLQASHTIAVPVVAASSTTFDVASGSNLSVQGGLTSNSGATLVKNGAGSLQLTGGATLGDLLTINAGAVDFGGTVNTVDIVNHGALNVKTGTATVGLLMGSGTTALDTGASLSTKGFHQTTLTIANGALVSVAHQASRTTSYVKTLDIAGGALPVATLDLGDILLIVDYDTATPKAAIVNQVLAGRNIAIGGVHDYDGFGIKSADAISQNALAGFEKFVVAAIDNADYVAINGVGYTSFSGTTVDPSSVLVRYTYAGDANLDGAIDSADYALINAAYAGTIANYGWLSGDFNADGTINADDYAVIDFGFLSALGSPLGAGSPVAVPEPTALCLLTAGASALLGRRRRACR